MSLIKWAPLAALLAFASPAQAIWREASSTHFLIYSEDSASRLKEFSTELERYDAAMRFLRNVPPADPGKANRVTVYVVANLTEVRQLNGAPRNSGIAGYYRGSAGSSIAIIPRSMGGSSMDPEVVLLHEYAHHFMYANFAGAWPRWFIEGFAEFNSTASFSADGSVGLGKPPLFRAYSLVNMAPMPIEKLLEPPEKMDAEDSDVFYGRAWLLTHYLTLDKGREGQLAAYLTAINSGTPNLEAARKAFGDLDKLNKELNAYLHKRTYFFSIAGKALNPGPIEVRDLGPAEQALMDLRIRSRNGVDDKGATEVLALARISAAPFPNDPFAQTVLAEAEFDTDHFDEAAAAAERALAADPKSMDGMLYRARILAHRARSEKYDPAAWKAVRSAYIAANHIDPDDPRPLFGFYQAFLSEGIAPTKSAVAGLMRAQELAPQDGALRMTAASQYLRDDKPREARAMLTPLAYDPHPSEASQAALAMIQAIDQKQPKAASANAGATPH